MAPIKYMNAIDKVLFWVSVPKCVFCGERLERYELALCKDCKNEYYDSKERSCSVCGNPVYHCTCTNKYLESHFIHKLIKVYRYQIGEELPSNTLIYKLKRDYRRDVFDFLTEELVKSFSYSQKIEDGMIITSVPRRRKSKKKYGYDHAKILAKALSKRLSVEYAELLSSKTKIAQKKAQSVEERKQNAIFKLKNEKLDLSGKTVVLVDDIVTTGASMGACAFQLKALAPKKIIGASIAIAYKDVYQPPSSEDRFYKR